MFATFPLFPITAEGKCSCNNPKCEDIGKHPAYAFGQLKHGQQVKSQYGAGYGIATGSRSGVFVVDLDGEEAVKHFHSLGIVPVTFVVKTGREEPGYHIYFQMPDFMVRNDQGRKLGHRKIDIRGEGGYVVGPGSPHRSGKLYTIEDESRPAPAPEWLLDLLKKEAVSRSDASWDAPRPIRTDGQEYLRRIGLAKTFLEEEAEPAIQGDNGSGALWLVAQKLVRSYEFPLEIAAHLIEEFYNPRCSPPWTDQQIWHKLEDARDRGTWMCGIASEDFVKNMVEAGKPAAIKHVDRTKTSRRTHTPGHTYSHVPGHNSAATERKVIPVSDAVSTLTSHPDWLGVWQYDEFRRALFAVDPPLQLDAETVGLSDRDVTGIRTWFEAQGVKISRPDITDAIHAAAKRCSFHPVREYLLSLEPPEKMGLLDGLAKRAFGQADAMPQVFMKKFLVAAVRRILQPGVKVDTMLVLYSAEQGRNKSTSVEVLFGEKWYRDQMPALEGRDASHALEGYWGIELAELDKFMKAETSTTKDFLSRRIDNYRQFGNGQKIEFPRECVFIGTTNQPNFLRDETGDRRSWPIEVVGKIDLDYIRKNRDAIWAEAVVLAQDKNFHHWLDDEEEANAAREKFKVLDAWEESIADYCAGREIVTTNEVYLQMIASNDLNALAKFDKRTSNRVGAALRNLGCEYTHVIENGKRVRVWKVSDRLKAMTPSNEETKRRAAKAIQARMGQN